MSSVRYPHEATKALEKLEPLNGPRLYDRIYNEILIPGLSYAPENAEECRSGAELLGNLMEIHNRYCKEAGPFGDIFGEYLENNEETNARNGQFFTPISLVDATVGVTFGEMDLSGPPLEICDPAAGTGRFMLRTACHFMEKNHGALNFLFTNIDIDRRVWIYCVMNAVLSGIPSICIHGDTLGVEVYEAFATIPIGQVAQWGRVRPEIAKELIVRSTKTPAAKPAKLIMDIHSGKYSKKYHPWEQSIDETLYYLSAVAQKGQIVCDPFCGSGTNCLAAKLLDMDYIGMDIDPDACKTAESQLRQLPLNPFMEGI